jgi:hypothetical protein
LREDLYRQQKDRTEYFRRKLKPIVIRDAPSRMTNFKIQLKYLQYEIHPLTQGGKDRNVEF